MTVEELIENLKTFPAKVTVVAGHPECYGLEDYWGSPKLTLWDADTEHSREVVEINQYAEGIREGPNLQLCLSR